jgi:cation transport regulator ChaC
VLRYFAYGSNMRRARLEARVGEVIDEGWATLAGWRHRFNKHGTDGTAKGNIEIATGHEVHGVLYRLRPKQVEVLARYEVGYQRVELDVHHRATGDVRALSFTATALHDGLEPTADYVAHYEHGMIEHELPAAYRRWILTDALGENLP